MRLSTLAALALVAACKNSSQETPKPPPPPPTTIAPAPTPAATPTAPTPPGVPDAPTKNQADAGTPLKTTAWKPPLTPEEDKALDKYLAFSDDSLAFAIAEVSKGAGLTVVTFYAVPTGTVEKRLVLDTPAARTKAAEELSADGFPKPGQPSTAPNGFDAQVEGDAVQVRVAGQPAGKPFKPFASGKPTKADVLALTPDGKTAAVRVTAANGAGEFGPQSEIRFQKLFE